MSKRDFLTKRIPGGWTTPCGRVRAVRDTELLDAKRDGAVSMGVGRTTFWTLELIDNECNVIDTESVNTLTEADEEAWIFMNRIAEGRA